MCTPNFDQCVILLSSLGSFLPPSVCMMILPHVLQGFSHKDDLVALEELSQPQGLVCFGIHSLCGVGTGAMLVHGCVWGGVSFWSSVYRTVMEGRHCSGMQPHLVHVTLFQCTKLF